MNQKRGRKGGGAQLDTLPILSPHPSLPWLFVSLCFFKGPIHVIEDTMLILDIDHLSSAQLTPPVVIGQLSFHLLTEVRLVTVPKCRVASF